MQWMVQLLTIVTDDRTIGNTLPATDFDRTIIHDQ